MYLFRDESTNPKYDAQRNLSGRNHYVDDATLKTHKSRILFTTISEDKLLYALVESRATASGREFAYAVFSVFGNTVATDGGYYRRLGAERAMYRALKSLDAVAITQEEVNNRLTYALSEHKRDLVALENIRKAKSAS